MVDKNHKFYARHYASQLLIITHIYVPVTMNVNCNSYKNNISFWSTVYTAALFNYHVHDATGLTYNAEIINELAKRPVRLDSRQRYSLVPRSRGIFRIISESQIIGAPGLHDNQKCLVSCSTAIVNNSQTNKFGAKHTGV